jgi:nitroimidazol reductase NimA-like FMN-containing flavoprotein (pyridoxamine 5'-phosphate oxidase superfamily)
MTTDPAGELDPRYSTEGIAPTPWSRAADALTTADLAWFSTVRPGGQPHVTPLNFVYAGGRLFMHTGPHEQKATNLAADPRCALVVGSGSMTDGLDVIVEGAATRIDDHASLQLVADALEAKYGADWHYEVGDGDLVSADGPRPIVFEVVPTTAYGFGKGETFSQTRWRFDRN